MSRIEDSRSRINASEERFKNSDYVGAIREAGACIELSVKALLDMLQINYTTKQGRIPHDVSNKVPEAYEKLKPYLEEWEVKNARLTLARAMVLLRLLSSIRSYVEYPIKKLEVEAKDVFDYYFSKELAKTLTSLVRSTYRNINNWVGKMKRKKNTSNVRSVERL